MRLTATLAALALTALVPAAVSAHVQLTASTPAAGTAAAKGTKTVTLTFSQQVDKAKTSAAIIMTAMPGMPNHGEMPIRNFTPAFSADGKALTLTLAKPLPTGSYEVRWRATASDGHPISGTVKFDVK
jgi:methionine-rich copper-binding protein CopC